jgi:hypothetical protein
VMYLEPTILPRVRGNSGAPATDLRLRSAMRFRALT